jgi:hypothetical protein
MEVTRRADGRARFVINNHWAHSGLLRLVELGLVETDGEGKYRVRSCAPAERRTGGRRTCFISPQIRQILEQSQNHFDLSSFGP